jgi:hypothetical protein
VVLGSKNVCLVPLLVEFTWLFCGASGMEFAEDVRDIRRALRSGRDVTVVPSGFATIGTGGRVDWRRRHRLFTFVRREAERAGRRINLVPVLWFYELGAYRWFMLGGSYWERLRVKTRLPLGGFAMGHSPLTFWLPKRGPCMIGVGRHVALGPGADEPAPRPSASAASSPSRRSSLSRGPQHCARCDANVGGLFRRRHHCRQCGRAVCGRCSDPYRAVVTARAWVRARHEAISRWRFLTPPRSRVGRPRSRHRAGEGLRRLPRGSVRAAAEAGEAALDRLS